MENLKAVNQELVMAKDLISIIEHNLEKADFILSIWVEEYNFDEKPDPRAAIEYMTRRNQDPHGKQSAKWFWEYNRIQNFIEIAMDYITNSQKLIKQSRQSE